MNQQLHTTLLLPLLAAALFTASAHAADADGEAIVKKARCVACHAVDAKRVGPAYYVKTGPARGYWSFPCATCSGRAHLLRYIDKPVRCRSCLPKGAVYSTETREGRAVAKSRKKTKGVRIVGGPRHGQFRSACRTIGCAQPAYRRAGAPPPYCDSCRERLYAEKLEKQQTANHAQHVIDKLRTGARTTPIELDGACLDDALAAAPKDRVPDGRIDTRAETLRLMLGGTFGCGGGYKVRKAAGC